MFICEACKKKPATVHLTNIENNNIKKQVHLCESCAQKGKLSFKFQLPQMTAVSLNDESEVADLEMPALVCEACGITWQEFRSGGRFGCANDVVVFRDRLKGLIGEIQAHAFKHNGKQPVYGDVRSEEQSNRNGLRRQLREYRQQLYEAARNEEYEKAAELRDHITELKKALAGENTNDH